MQFVCPCGERLTFTTQMVGKKGKCPKCGRVTLIDAAAMSPRAAAPASPVTAPLLPLQSTPAQPRSVVVPIPNVIQPAPLEPPPAPTITPAPQPGRATLFIGLGVVALLFIGVSIAATLWTMGFFSKGGQQVAGENDTSSPVDAAVPSTTPPNLSADSPEPETVAEVLPDAESSPLPAADAARFSEFEGEFQGLNIGQGDSACTFKSGGMNYLLWFAPNQREPPELADMLVQLRAQVVIAKVNAFNGAMQRMTAGDNEGARSNIEASGRLERLSQNPGALERMAHHLQIVTDLGLMKGQSYRLEGTVVDDADGSQPWLIVTSIDGQTVCTKDQALELRVENHEYIRWAKCRPGVAVTFRSKTVVAAQTYVTTQTVSPEEIEPSHVLLKTVSSVLPRRPEVEEVVSQTRIPRFILASHDQQPQAEASGEEQLSTLKLTRTKTRTIWKDGEDRDREATTTTWKSDWVPGQIVRRITERDEVDANAGLQKIEESQELIEISGPGTDRIARAWQQHRWELARPQVAALTAAITSGDKLTALKELTAVAELAGRGPLLVPFQQQVDQIPWPEKLTFELGGEPSQQLVLVQIPAGSFRMGSAEGEPNERPLHKVTFTSPFYMSESEVTEGQWKAIQGSYTRVGIGTARPFLSDQHPADGVWFGPINDFLQAVERKTEWQGHFRIPTEAEWEYACRAGSTGSYGFGDVAAQLGDYAWFKDTAGDGLKPVKQKKPNAWGLYDMHGNALEFCSDSYRDVYEAADQTNLRPARIDGYRSEAVVVRSGSWQDDARSCRSASRRPINCGKLANEPDVGFRVVFQPELGD